LKVTSELDRTKEVIIATNCKILSSFTTEQELDKKFGDTAQYNNLRTMLTSKNAQLKELREQLKKWVWLYISHDYHEIFFRYEPDSF